MSLRSIHYKSIKASCSLLQGIFKCKELFLLHIRSLTPSRCFGTGSTLAISFYKIALLVILSIVLFSFNLGGDPEVSGRLFAQKPTAETFFDIGVQNSKNTEYSEAIDAFKHAIKLKPDYAEAYYNLGHVYYNLHRYTEAIDAYKEAVKVKPNYVEAYISLGIVSSMLSRYDEAIEALKKAVKINPKNAEAHYRLGNIYSELEKSEEAIEAFKQAVKIKPKFAEARYNLGVAYLELSKKALASARKEYKSLKRLNKDLASELRKLMQEKK